MITHSLVQGSPEWAAHRRQFFNASDAPAMMNCSAYKTRDQLLHEMHTGLTKEVDAATQRRFDDGHRFEALARPLAVKIIGEQLFPVVGSEGKLSASFDGLTMGEDTAFEHKSLNDDLRACMRDQGNGWDLPLQYQVQMEQQLMVSGAERVLFMASKWNGDEMVEERHCWYASDPALRARILAGWEQFDQDLCAYVPVEVLDKPIVITRRPGQLPALRSAVSGELVLESNIKEWEEAALAYIKGVSEHELKTDEDFENADEAAKWCVTSKTTLMGVQSSLMSATGDVNVAVSTIDRIMAELDKTRLAFTKKIDARKAARKGEMLVENQTLLGDHLRNLNKRLGRDFMPQIPVDFAGAIHGKRSFDSMAAALNAALANAKIEANRIADKIAINLKALDEKAKDHGFLFNDLGQRVLMENDHFALMVDKRISDHVAEQKRKDDETRENARKEAEAKAAEFSRAALVKIQGIQNQLQAAQGAKLAVVRQILADTEAVVVDVATFGVHNDLAVDAKRQTVDALRALVFHPNGAPRYSTTNFRSDGEPIMLNDDGTRSVFCDVDEEPGDAPAAAPAAAPAPAPAAAPDPAMQQVHAVVRAATPPPSASAQQPVSRKVDTPPTLSLGQIGARLGFNLTAAFLSTLGFDGDKVKGAVLFHEHQYPQICAALIQHIHKVSELQTA